MSLKLRLNQIEQKLKVNQHEKPELQIVQQVKGDLFTDGTQTNTKEFFSTHYKDHILISIFDAVPTP